MRMVRCPVQADRHTDRLARDARRLEPDSVSPLIEHEQLPNRRIAVPVDGTKIRMMIAHRIDGPVFSDKRLEACSTYASRTEKAWRKFCHISRLHENQFLSGSLELIPREIAMTLLEQAIYAFIGWFTRSRRRGESGESHNDDRGEFFHRSRASRKALVIGYLLSRPKLLRVIFTPGGAWRRLYSLT